MQVEQIDRELFIAIADKSDHDEEILAGHHFTWEVEQIARHRHQARDEVVGEIERLEKQMAEAYQLAGSIAFDHDINGPDIERLLDLLSGINLSKD